MDRQRERFEFAHVDTFGMIDGVPPAQRSGCGDETRHATDHAGGVPGKLQRGLVGEAVDRSPADPGAHGQVVAGNAGQRIVKTVGSDGQVNRIGGERGEDGGQCGIWGDGGRHDHIRAPSRVGQFRLGIYHHRMLVPVEIGMDHAAVGTRPVVEEWWFVA